MTYQIEVFDSPNTSHIHSETNSRGIARLRALRLSDIYCKVMVSENKSRAFEIYEDKERTQFSFPNGLEGARI